MRPSLTEDFLTVVYLNGCTVILRIFVCARLVRIVPVIHLLLNVVIAVSLCGV